MKETYLQWTCDGCGYPEQINAGGTTADERKDLYKVGWRFLSKDRDYCPDCVKIGKHLEGKSMFQV